MKTPYTLAITITWAEQFEAEGYAEALERARTRELEVATNNAERVAIVNVHLIEGPGVHTH